MSVNGGFIRDFLVLFVAGTLGYAVGLHFGLRPGAVGVSAAALALLALQAMGGGFAQIGFAAPPKLLSWIGLTALGIVMFYVFAGGAVFLTQKLGMAADVSSFAYLQGNLPAYLTMLAISWSSAAFAEEIVFRGFLLNRLKSVDGGGWLAGFTALMVSSALFGAAHFYQGPGGMIVTAAAGAALGTLTLVARGNIWPAIVTHGIVDTIGMTAFFLGAGPG